MTIKITPTATWHRSVAAYCGAGPAFAVCASDRDGYEHCEIFEGITAFSDANDFFERMKAMSSVHELTLLRFDAGDWSVLAPQSRNNDGDTVRADDGNECSKSACGATSDGGFNRRATSD